MKTVLAGALIAACLTVAAASDVQARGCLKGAVIGGVAGHFLHHHAVLGAIAGCAIGHHLAVQKEREKRAQLQQQQAQKTHW